MKTVKPGELKALGVGLGLCAAFLAMSFMMSPYDQSIDRNPDPVPKTIPASQHDRHYTEVRGMN